MTTDRPGFDSVALSPEQERALQRLAFAIEAAEGQFKLLIARCNYDELTERLVARLQTLCAVEVRRLDWPPGDRQLFPVLERAIEPQPPGALAITGLGGLTDGELRDLFAQANRSREALRDRFPLPLVWWLDDRSLQQLQNTASDLASWATSQTFAATPEQLADWVRSMAQQALGQLWETRPQPLPDRPIAELLRYPITIAAQDWQTAIAEPLDLTSDRQAETEIHLAWLSALAQPTDPAAPAQYERAITFWEQRGDGATVGALRILLGEYWRSRGLLSRRDYATYLVQARDQFAAAIAAFDQADRADLSAKFINAWGDTLQRLTEWDALASVAEQAAALHDRYPHPFKQARAWAYRGQLALLRQDWAGAIDWLNRALIAVEESELAEWQLPGDAESLDWVQASSEAWYRFLRAEALQAMGDRDRALADLQWAIEQTQPTHEPRLYIRILQAIAQAHRDRRDYAQAFQTKLQCQEIEQQFNFQAFVGAGRLQVTQRQRQWLALSLGDDPRQPPTITAAGRDRDVQTLWKRLANDRGDQVTVLFGFSGSGKSSLLTAGLIPLVQQKSLGVRDGLPVLLRDYTDWQRGLWQALQRALGQYRIEIEPPTDGDWQGAIIRELIRNAEQRNLATVLIFDQLEEFFFENGQRQGRSPLFEFLGNCLDITGLKIVFSIRREYIYYLLNREQLDQKIDGGLLSTKALYRIGNFRLAEAKQVIADLIDRAELDWEPELIEAIVADLAGNYYKVRPIELQIVGAQVQAEGITTAAAYANSGGKMVLVQNYLDSAIGDCGLDNLELAKLILFLLTGDQPIRPLKNSCLLRQEVTELQQNPRNLDLVLKILVGSGLLLENHSQTNISYQIVHDYIAEFIQEQTKTNFFAEIAQEKAQRQAAEQKLSKQHQVAKQRFAKLKNNILRMKKLQKKINLVALISILTTVAILVALSESFKKDLLSVQESLLRSALDQDEQVVKLANLLRIGFAIHKQKLDYRLFESLQKSLSYSLLNSQELNFLRIENQAHIRDIEISPNDKLLAIALEDGTTRIWDIKLMREIRQFRHSRVKDTQVIYGLSFSPNGLWLLTSGQDGTAKIWNLNQKNSQKPFATFIHGIGREIRAANFDNSGRWIVTAGNDGMAKVWEWREQQQNIDVPVVTLVHLANKWLSSANFSPDGKRVFTVGGDGVAKIWDWQSNRQLNNSNPINFRKFDSGILGADFSADGQWLGIALKSGAMNLWNWSTNQRLITLKTHSDSIRSIVFGRKNQSLLITSSSDKSAILWKWNAFLETKKSVIKSQCFDKNIVTLSHPNWVERAKFSFNEMQIISASNGGVIRFWNVTKGAIDREKLRNQALKKMSKEELLNLDVAKYKSLKKSNVLKGLADIALCEFTDSDWLSIISHTQDLNDLLNIGCSWLRDYLMMNRDAPADLQEFCRVKPSQKP
jgi:WD40 repeat protein